jgi:hypothetical protein
VQPNVEIIRLQKSGEYYDAQLAVDGKLAVPMEIHASCRDQYPTEAEFIAYLTRSAEMMIELYGDARHPQRLDANIAGAFDVN